MGIVAFRLGPVTAHDYGDGQLVLWAPKDGDRFNCESVRVDARKLKRKLKKFCRRL